MDTISAGMTIALACECYTEGVITKEDTGGLELGFGDADLMIQLLELTANREGFGDALAQGAARLAKQWGVEDRSCNLAVKGQELSMHDPRVKVGVGLGFAINTYGADHMVAAHDPFYADKNSATFKSIKTLGIDKAMPATVISNEKVENYIQLEKLWRMMDALGLCVFGYAPRGVIPIEVMVESLNAITGWNTQIDELLAAADRGSMLARAFNSREGFSIKDDRLPKRLFKPKPDGPDAGKLIFKEDDFKKAIQLYYEMIACDPETGKPSQNKLKELGLEWVGDLM
jgi:aldehyde:ferredoxin oxidoreductase